MTNYPTLLGTGGHTSDNDSISYYSYYSNVGLGRNPMVRSFTTESFVSQTTRVPGTISYLSWGSATTIEPSKIGLTLSLNVNSLSSALAVSINASSPTTGFVTDSTDTVSVSNGDALDFRLALSSLTKPTEGLSGEFYCVSARFDPSTTGTVPGAQIIDCVGFSSLQESAALQPVCFLGIVSDGTSPESTQQIYALAAGRWQNMACNIENNTIGSGNSILVSNRIGGSNGSMQVSFPAGCSGLLEDTSDHNDLCVGDLVNYGFQCSESGSGSFTVQWIGAYFLATDATLCMIGGSPGGTGSVVIASGHTLQNPIFGGGEIVADMPRATGLFPYALKGSYYTNHLVGPPSGDGVATFTLLKNGAATVLSVISSAQTGYFMDSTDTVCFDVGDTCANQVAVSAAGGSVTWASAALLLGAV